MKTALKNIATKFKRSIASWIVQELSRTAYIHGNKERLSIGRRVSLVNTLINTASGDVTIGDDVVFGHNCMILTGRHEFLHGRRKRLAVNLPDTPHVGFDVTIGNGTWVASGVIIIGGVTIGENCIVAAGAVVTKDVPRGSFVAGVPAKIVKTNVGV